VPYTPNYSLLFYFVTGEEILEGTLLHRFIFGDDTFRNSRLSLIPAVPEVDLGKSLVSCPSQIFCGMYTCLCFLLRTVVFCE
jgi:hypothetical protein